MNRSHSFSRLSFRAAALLCVLQSNSLLYALEGGVTSTGKNWNSSITHEPVDEALRVEEQAARKKAIQADIQRLNDRLSRKASAADSEELMTHLENIRKQQGWAPEVGMVFGTRDILSITKGQDALHPNLLASFVQFKEDMAKRDIDVIFLPFPPTPHVYGHDLVEGISADQEYTPGWTKMMLQMLEADLEVIDPLTEWRKASKDKMVIKWPNDFHTASGGRMIAGDLLAERLQRYDFARELKPNTEQTSFNTREQRSTKKRIGQVNSKGSYAQDTVAVNHVALLKDRTFEVVEYDRKGSGRLPMKSELVMIGDSENHSAVYGTGWPEIVMNKVGGRFRWGSRSGGIGRSMNPIYLDVVPDYAVQPRVVVVTCLVKYFWDQDVPTPQELPELGAVNDEGIPVEPFDVTVELLKISKTPADDPKALDYDQALFHSAAKIIDGPDVLKGKEIGLRYSAMYKDAWTPQRGKQEVGKKYTLRIHYWPEMVKNPRRRNLAQVEVFDDTDQDLLIPIFWTQAGELSGFRRPAKM